MKNDLLYHKKDNEKLLGLKILYYSVNGILMNLANYTRLDTALLINLVVRYNFTLTQRHWNKVNHVPQ